MFHSPSQRVIPWVDVDCRVLATGSPTFDDEDSMTRDNPAKEEAEIRSSLNKCICQSMKALLHIYLRHRQAFSTVGEVGVDDEASDDS